MTFLSAGEFSDLFYALPEYYRPFVMMLVSTGIRFGEATALQVGDIDVESGSARIRQAWKKTGSARRELGSPKSKRSNRTVAIPKPVIALLAPLLEAKKASDFVFTTPTGKLIQQQYFAKIWTQAVSTFAGDTVRIDHDGRGRKIHIVVNKGQGKHPRVHDCRHTFVSWAIASGTSLVVIQRQLGHESITTTINTYGHLARADFDALANSTANFLPSARAIEG